MFKNSERYADPTAGAALAHIIAEERRLRHWIKALLRGPAYLNDSMEWDPMLLTSKEDGGNSFENSTCNANHQ